MAGLLGGFNPETQAAIDEYAAMDGLLAPPRPERFWQGGEKFGVKDGLAGLLAVFGDALARNAGGEGFAVQGLLGGRSSALDEFKKRAEQERKMQQTMALIQQAYPNLSPAQQQAMAAGVGAHADFKPPEPTGTTRLMQESKNWGPDDWSAFAKLNPVQGADGQYYPRNMGGGEIPTAPVGELTPIGGGTGNGAGGFPFRR